MPNTQSTQRPQKTFEELKNEFATSVIVEIAQSIKSKSTPFFRDISADKLTSNRGYNALNGVPLDGLNSLKADMKQAQFNYPKNQWISLADAMKMGQKGAEGYKKIQEEVETIKKQYRAEMVVVAKARSGVLDNEFNNAAQKLITEAEKNNKNLSQDQAFAMAKEAWINENTQTNWRNKSFKIQFVQTHKVQNVLKRDANGNPIPLLDENGKQRFSQFKDKDSNSIPLYEYEPDLAKPYTDKNGRQGYEPKKETVPLEEPIFRTELLYNINEFKSIDVTKIKSLNENIQRKHILSHKNDEQWREQHQHTRVVFDDIKDKLTPQIAEQIKEYFKAQNNNIDYKVPRPLNNVQKNEVEQIASKVIENQNNLFNQKIAPTQTQTQEKAQEAPKVEQTQEVKQETQEQKQTQAKKPAVKSKGRGR